MTIEILAVIVAVAAIFGMLLLVKYAGRKQ